MTIERQTQALANWFPRGPAFDVAHIDGSRSRAILRGLAAEQLRMDDALDTFRRELVPSRASLLLTEWEAMVGIPDDCFTNTAGTDAERRRNVIAKLVASGVQTAQDFVDLAALFGVTAVLTAGSVHTTFPATFPIYLAADDREGRHTIFVQLGSPAVVGFPIEFPYVFGSAEEALIECLFRRLKPANVQLVFGFPP